MTISQNGYSPTSHCDLRGRPSQRLRTETFEQHRSTLIGAAYRILGSRSDAEDVVQDAGSAGRASTTRPSTSRGRSC